MLKIATFIATSFMFSNLNASSEMITITPLKTEIMGVMFSAIDQDDKALLQKTFTQNDVRMEQQDIAELIHFASGKRRVYLKALEIKRGAFAGYFLEKDTQIVPIIRFLKDARRARCQQDSSRDISV